MVPEGWDHTNLGDLLDFKNGYNTEKANYGGGTRFINVSEVLKHERLTASMIPGSVKLSASSEEAYRVNRGDILFNRTSETTDEVGFTTVYLDDEPVIFGGFVIRGRPKNGMLHPEFASYAMRQPMVRSEIIRRSQGAVRANVGQGELSKVEITLPPLPEQRKIAEILSTWDRAIETTEALLATARTQKRALMQSLLTGNRRFPEFEQYAWKEVRLGDVASVIVSNVDKKIKDGERPVRLCNYTDVYKRDTINPRQPFMWATATPAQIRKFGLKVGDVIITKDSETADDIAMPTYVAETADDLVCGYHLAIVRPGSMVDGRFLKFFFEMPHTRYYFGTRANGAIRFGLTIDGIEGAKLRLPPIDEQRRIAEVIAATEVEISRLFAEIEKLRTEKKALMQQLLTGKRRVRVEAA
jgi:type I restriction enzyme S subunit